MKLTEYFIRHPVIALVLNSMILIVGLLCFKNIAVREYPEVTLPVLAVTAQFPNASAELVESGVTHPLEDQLGGVEGLESMTSQSSQGSCNIMLVFKEGTSLDKTLSVLRDKINLARAHLPKEVPEPVIQRQSISNGIPFIAIALSSTDKNYGELTHFANLYLKNAFRSIDGVSSVEVAGQPYTMEVVLDLHKMYAFGVNADEVYQAIEKYTHSWPVGKYRNEVPTTIELNLKEVDDFNKIFVKNRSNGKAVFLHSIADVKLATDNKSFRVRLNGQPGLMLSIDKASDANPVEVSKLVHKQLSSLQKTLPPDLQIEVMLDQTAFIKASLHNIKSSIVEAVLLVLIIVFVFLRNLRSTLIPLVTIPISLIGSIIFLKLFGFSINTLTLLAMVLAIGLVVDDAIVVLENIARHIEKGLSPLEAAIKGSREIGFAVVAMTFTLASVYLPLAFIEGVIGQLFIEFAVALAGAVFISGVVALSLSPLMCAKMLKPHQTKPLSKIDLSLKKAQEFYRATLEKMLASSIWICGGAFAVVLGVIFLFNVLPQETVPKEDRGLIGVYVPYIPGKDMNSFESVVSLVEKQLKSIPEAKGYLTFMGEWGGSICIPLKDQGARKRSASEIMSAIQPMMSQLPSIDAWAWSWDSGLPGMDDAMNGSELTLAISTAGDYRTLLQHLNNARQEIEEQGVFDSVHHNLKLDTPGYKLALDTHTLSRAGLSPSQVAKMVEIFFSGDQSLSFHKEGISYPITIKGNIMPWTLNELYLNTPKDKKISVGAIAEMKPSTLPKEIHHHNQMRSVNLTTALKKDQKIEPSMKNLLHSVNKVIPGDFKKEWIGAAKSYNETTSIMMWLLILSLVFIYAILSIQFENFSDPFIIMLTIPLACFGALLIAYLFNQSLNLYTQIGLITLSGLITKHGILIVEFANQKLKQGETLLQAIQEAAGLRLRPILMTTGAMILRYPPFNFCNRRRRRGTSCNRVYFGGGVDMWHTLDLVCFAFALLSNQAFYVI